MTLEIVDGQTDYLFYLNGEFPTSNKIIVTSQYSNLPVIDVDCIVVEANPRYTELSFILPIDFGLEHKNGIYNYTILNNAELLVEGIVKLIYEPGGETGTVPYISNNENREAVVYFRPQY